MSELRLAALLCSKLCHDLIGPIGAFSNGLEILAEEDDPLMRQQAGDLLGESAEEAANRLQFFRVAFGAGDGMGGRLGESETHRLAAGMLSRRRVMLDWPAAEDGALEKSEAKLLLNLVLLAAGALPRGGTLSVRLRTDEGERMRLHASGRGARLDPEVRQALSGGLQESLLDTHTVVAYMALMLARDLDLAVRESAADDALSLRVTPA